MRTNKNSTEKSENGYTGEYKANIEEKEDITVEEFRANVEMMNRLMEESVKEIGKGKRSRNACPSSLNFINGNVLSAVFALSFLVIVSVSVYAFYNLFVAILKKFPSKHTEL